MRSGQRSFTDYQDLKGPMSGAESVSSSIPVELNTSFFGEKTEVRVKSSRDALRNVPKVTFKI